ncbi:hypothetical protein BC567DRAFT_232341 [Phyllosticta citribraziliensis]
MWMRVARAPDGFWFWVKDRCIKASNLRCVWRQAEEEKSVEDVLAFERWKSDAETRYSDANTSLCSWLSFGRLSISKSSMAPPPAAAVRTPTSAARRTKI